MKTNEEVLQRYLSEESVDFFSAQRRALLGTLPFSMAKPYLDQTYVQQTEDGTLPEEEKWVENYDVKKQITDFLPEVYAILYKGQEVHTIEGLLYLKAWIWIVDPEFHDELTPLFEGDIDDFGKALLDKIANHYGYNHYIQDVEFEEVPEEEEKD